jgi:hypothetical protein
MAGDARTVIQLGVGCAGAMTEIEDRVAAARSKNMNLAKFCQTN